jgi:hypothetical protein
VLTPDLGVFTAIAIAGSPRHHLRHEAPPASHCFTGTHESFFVTPVNTYQKASSATNIVSSNPEELSRDCLLSFRRTRKSHTRRFDRYRTELPLVVKVLGRHGYVRVHGRCFELAEAGLGVVTTSELAVGEMVSVELFAG